MGRSYFLLFILVSLILALSFSTGCGRILVVSFGGDELHPIVVKDSGKKARETVELMDYSDPGPNFNSRSGLPITNPSPSPSPPSVPPMTPPIDQPSIHQ